MNPDEINELINRVARSSAQETIAKLNESATRPFVTIDTASTAFSVVGAICVIVVGYYALRIAPIESDVEENKQTIQKMEKKMDEGFDRLSTLIMELKK